MTHNNLVSNCEAMDVNLPYEQLIRPTTADFQEGLFCIEKINDINSRTTEKITNFYEFSTSLLPSILSRVWTDYSSFGKNVIGNENHIDSQV